jgi:hypothetical protein
MAFFDNDSAKYVLGLCVSALGVTGGWIYNGTQGRFKRIEAELDLKASEAELNRQRDNIGKLFAKVEEIRSTMIERVEFNSLRDIIIDRLPPRS